MNSGEGNISSPHPGTGAMARSSRSDGQPVSGASGISRMRQSARLPATALESRRMIHEGRAYSRPTKLFRELRSNLLHSSGQRNPIILVSGVSASCGVSYVARNLAIAIAMEEDRSALLIDCNMERASQDSAFNIVNRAGLSDYLSSSELPVERIIHGTGIPRLRVISAGSAAHQNSDSLGSLRMRALLEGLQQRYDDRCLVLDVPAACGSPDARALAQRADLVILVAGEALHRPEQVMEAAAVFDPAKFAGVIFNEMP